MNDDDDDEDEDEDKDDDRDDTDINDDDKKLFFSKVSSVIPFQNHKLGLI